MPSEEKARRRSLPGRSALIVPPAAVKTAYYRTPILTQLWQDARYALSRAKVRVSLIGYSIPLTDLVTCGMLRDTLRDRRTNPDDVTIDIVNPSADKVAENLKAIGLGDVKGDRYCTVADFVDQYVVRGARPS